MIAKETDAMHIRPLEAGVTSSETLCKGFLITQIASFDQLLQSCDRYSKEFPEDTILLSLDDLGQSQYTSGHAVGFHNLDDTDGHDLSAVDRRAFEEGEHIGYLSTPSEFFIREENFKRLARTVTFDDACAKGLTLDDDELTALERIHATPELVLDSDIVMWIVPVKERALALCASPNGYFSADLSPFENFALASHLDQQYGYALFGIGASCIGLRRTSPLHDDAAQALARDLACLYNCPDNEDTARRLLDLIRSRSFLILKYGEYLDMSAWPA